MARFLDQVRGNDAVNDAQHPPHDLGPAGKQETQLKREAQHPLTHGLFRQYFINQQGGTFGHPPRPTARAETATLTAESDQVLGVARLAANRSEEHTSELQSRPHLVCRLLLEKKKS